MQESLEKKSLGQTYYIFTVYIIKKNICVQIIRIYTNLSRNYKKSISIYVKIVSIV